MMSSISSSRPRSRNLGAVDHRALIGGGDLLPERNPDGAFMLLRIGDASNIHAAIAQHAFPGHAAIYQEGRRTTMNVDAKAAPEIPAQTRLG
jgi:hypothetical protein